MDGRSTGMRPPVLTPLGYARNRTSQAPPEPLMPSQSTDGPHSSASKAPPNAPASGAKDRDEVAELLACELKICSHAHESNRLISEVQKLELAIVEKRTALILSDQKKNQAIGAAAQLRKWLGLVSAVPNHETSLNAVGRDKRLAYLGRTDHKGSDDPFLGVIDGAELDVDMNYFSSPNLRDSVGWAKATSSSVSPECKDEYVTPYAPRRRSMTGSVASATSRRSSRKGIEGLSVFSLTRAAASGFKLRTGSRNSRPSLSGTADLPQNPTTPYPADRGLNLALSTTPALQATRSADDSAKWVSGSSEEVLQTSGKSVPPSNSGVEQSELSHSGKGFPQGSELSLSQSGRPRVKKILTISTPLKETAESESVSQTSIRNDGPMLFHTAPSANFLSANDDGIVDHPHRPDDWSALSSQVIPPEPPPSGEEYETTTPSKCSSTRSTQSRSGVRVQSSDAPPSPAAPPPQMPPNAPYRAPSKRWAADSSRIVDIRRKSVVGARPSNATGETDDISVFPLHPMSRLAQIWNALLIMIVGILLLLMPISLGFTEGRNILPVVSAISAAFYALGLWLNFHIGYVQGDCIYMESRTIVQKYLLRGDFFVDLIMRFPWVFVIGLNTAFVSAMSVFAYILLYCAVTTGQGPIGSDGRQDATAQVNPLTPLCPLPPRLDAPRHWGACIRNFFDVIDDSVPIDTPFERYTIGFYSSAAETLSAGFGSIPPNSTYRRWFGTLNIIIGATFQAVLVGNVSTFLIRLDCSGQRYNQMIDEVGQYIAYKGFPPSLKSRIIEFYEFKYAGGKYFNEKAILRELSGPLRRTVSVQNCKHLILKVPFFKDADNKFIADLSLVLEEKHFLDGDLIMHEGDEAEEMYFIWTGICAVSIQGIFRLELHAGAFFGGCLQSNPLIPEIALLFSGMRRTATITAVSPCILYSLSKQNLDAVLERFDYMAESIAEERLANFGKTGGTGAPPPPSQAIFKTSFVGDDSENGDLRD
ncbi:hypothetical protein BDK51DRAFT_25740 [Blyttiomyces helicus]|uniref:Cyclic nucleotide-binding domain-containing protein n=1 Tax=Blyttiomyces helicus TaxID=388810 RepID=A0A4P9WD24_9FUNG|nr:hypothetical protein BDK51DRAFT_25740 [Blyttiomyces helicus]|eukprot:RKO90424.1 hypothetical protein BDK51DRAFT_25740 [Blyttiomyces helicus]